MRLTQLTAVFSATLALCALCTGVGRAQSLIVQTDDGQVQGIETSGADAGMDAFLGIPYAAPPVGSLRWMPPQPHGPFASDPLAADNFGSECTQPDGSGSEDCLTLNVFTPQGMPGGLPVMVWIHGGGLVSGSSSLYMPTPLVVNGNVIVVTINYRLGYLGFFAHPAIDAEDHLKGNYGLMDQQFALNWVQRNIAAFGGDPNRVTIFGESAGGHSVYCNLASPTAAKLFGGAIAESGAYTQFQPYWDFVVPLRTAEKTGTFLVPSGIKIAASVGCANQKASCLRAVPAPKLVAGEASTIYSFVDGTILTQTPAAALAAGEFNQVPVISGGNHDEWRAFISASHLVTLADYRNATQAQFGPILGPVLSNFLYPLADYSQAPVALGSSGTDGIFACPERNSVRFLSQYVPTFAYEFNDENAPSIFSNSSFPLGAYHGAELSYLFDLFQRFGSTDPFTADQQSLSNSMVQYWTTFAANRDPNSAGEPVWTRYDASADQFQSLVPPAPMAESSFDGDHKCSLFWNGLVSALPATLSFPAQLVATRSAAEKVTLINGGNGGLLSPHALHIASIVAAGDFHQTNTCGQTLAAGQTCTVSVTFSPGITGSAIGTLTIKDDAANSPHTVTLNGVGTLVIGSPSSLAFAKQAVGTTSPAKKVSLRNMQKMALSISQIAAGGDFAQTNNCPAVLGAAKSCTIAVTFTPTATGARTDSIAVTADAFVPQIPLSGIGTP